MKFSALLRKQRVQATYEPSSTVLPSQNSKLHAKFQRFSVFVCALRKNAKANCAANSLNYEPKFKLCVSCASKKKKTRNERSVFLINYLQIVILYKRFRRMTCNSSRMLVREEWDALFIRFPIFFAACIRFHWKRFPLFRVIFSVSTFVLFLDRIQTVRNRQL